MTVYRGEAIAAGVAVGPVVLRGWEDLGAARRRIAADRVEIELNLLREALKKSRAQIEEIKEKERSSLSESELRIFDSHVSYLTDPMFVTEVENQIIQERFCAREAIHVVLEKYDRIFQLVESDMLRRRASDLRDVATRVLRNLADQDQGAAPRAAPSGPYILAARRLTTADMFNLDNERVDGIVAEEGGMSSHAAILARSMGIPTISGIRDLPRILREGDIAVVDASAGELRVAPEERLLQEYAKAAEKWKRKRVEAPEKEHRHATRDGVEIELLGSCGSLGEVELSRTFGLEHVGLYRTELLFMVDKADPTEDQLASHYRSVIEHAEGHINFRLLEVAGDIIDKARGQERNPAMGLRGVRALLTRQEILRRQIRAILRAAHGFRSVGVLVPFVTSISELQRVKAAILEERLALKRAKVPFAGELSIGPVVEVPAAALTVGPLLGESDFAVVALDDLQAHLLAADRDNTGVRQYLELVHPALFEVLSRLGREAQRREKKLILFGESAADPQRLPFYIGAGYRSFSIAPVRLRGILKVLRRYTADECRRIAARILEAPRSLDVQRILVNIETG
ncbi:MAG: phosphoenolpyruvate--protein phosphotransferase [Planctomycetota bacterium]